MLRSFPSSTRPEGDPLSILAGSFSARRNLPSCLKVAHCYYTVSAMAGSSRSSTLDFASSGPVSDRILGPLGQISTLNYSYGHAAVTAILTRQGEVLVAMGARICFSWDAASWRVYPAMRLADQLCAELTRVCTGKGKHYPDISLGTSPRLHSRFATIGLEPYLSCRHRRR